MPRAAKKPAKSIGVNRDEVRVLSIGQPWAELILLRRKPFEIRTWERSYRGPLLIHASMRWNRASAEALGIKKDSVTRGAIVGIVRLVDIRSFTKADAKLLKARRADTGWWAPGHLVWVLKGVHRIKPIPCSGQLGLYPPPKGLRTRIRRALQSAGIRKAII